MGVTGEGQGHAVAFRLVEVIGIVREQEVRRALAGEKPGPVRPAEDEVVDGAEHELSPSVAERHRLVGQGGDADRAQVLADLFRITAEVVVVAVDVPGAKGGA